MMLRPLQPRPSGKIPPLVLITLRRTPERTKQALERFKTLGFDPIILWASDGRDQEAAATMPRDPRCSQKGHLMQPGEVGCCMSWWRAAAMIVQNDWDRAIVFEDDFTPLASIQTVSNAIDELPDDFDLALLHNQQMPEPTKAKTGHTRSFWRVINSSWTTVAVCISNKGARTMLRTMAPFDRPVDCWIRDNDVGLNLYQPVKGWFRQDQWKPSTIRDNHQAGKIPRIMHRIWVGGGDIPQEFEAYWKEWQRLHPRWKFKTWDDAAIDESFPTHQAIQAARQMPQQVRNAAVSDIARYLILRDFGGMYVDTDFEPLKPFDQLIDSASILLADMTEGEPCNGLMAAYPNHLFIQQLADKATNNLKSGTGNILDLAGPRVVKEVLAPWVPGWPKPLFDDDGDVVGVAVGDTGITIAKPWVCFPYLWHDERPAHYGKSWAAHHWARSWWGEEEWKNHRHAQAVRRAAA